MGKKQFTIEQIISKLREAEIFLSKGSTITAVCRSLGVSEQTYYRWRKLYGGMHKEQAKRLKELEQEISRTTVTDTDRELFDQLQRDIESYATQVGRKKEEARLVEEDLIDLDDKIASREKELDMLYQKNKGAREQEVLIYTYITAGSRAAQGQGYPAPTPAGPFVR